MNLSHLESWWVPWVLIAVSLAPNTIAGLMEWRQARRKSKAATHVASEAPGEPTRYKVHPAEACNRCPACDYCLVQKGICHGKDDCPKRPHFHCKCGVYGGCGFTYIAAPKFDPKGGDWT